ncbi:MAG: hypothetical protein M1817_004335 [Caeruleum heppii]|nr:MAG: hypothetical protein M1817_004335 [Caeruleum heppii]
MADPHSEGRANADFTNLPRLTADSDRRRQMEKRAREASERRYPKIQALPRASGFDPELDVGEGSFQKRTTSPQGRLKGLKMSTNAWEISTLAKNATKTAAATAPRG